MKIKPLVKSFSENVPLRLLETIELNGESSEMVVTRELNDWLTWNLEVNTDKLTGADLRDTLNAYLEDLDESDVRSVQELIDFNIKHSEQELPPGEDCT